MSKYVLDGMETAAALKKVCKIKTKLARQGPIAHRGDAHNVEVLSSSVAGCDWATEALAGVSTLGLNFQQLHGEVEFQLQLSKEAEISRIKDEMFEKGSNTLLPSTTL